MSLVVFRADGGPKIGAGHVMRCLALAAAFEDAGWSVGFAASADTFQSVKALGASHYEKLRLPEVQNAEAAAMARHWSTGADVLVVDHYGRGAEFERAYRPWAKRIAAFDDIAERMHDVDVLIDAVNSVADYRKFVPAKCRILAGADYAIVHPAFRRARDRALARRTAAPAGRVLISLGQVDPPNLTTCALAALEAAEFAGAVDVVLGSSAPHLEAVRTASRGNVSLRVDAQPDEMAELMTNADLAIGAGGTTAWERCCLGLPTVFVKLAENQREMVAMLARAVVGINAGGLENGLEDRLSSALLEMLGDSERRAAFARAAAALTDGRGAERVVTAVS